MPAKRAGQRQRQGDVAADRNADGARHVSIGRDGAHAPAGLRALEQEPHGGDQHGAHHDDGERLAAKREARDLDDAAAGQGRRGARRARPS